MTDLTCAANAPGPDMFPRDRYTFQEFLGLERWVDGEVVRVRLRHRPELMNYIDSFHGGVLMSVLDAAMAGAIRAQMPGCSMVTIDMATHFMGSTRGEMDRVMFRVDQLDLPALVLSAARLDRRERNIVDMIIAVIIFLRGRKHEPGTGDHPVDGLARAVHPETPVGG